jgi:hypothetical protein
MLARQISLPRPLPVKLTPLRPYSCSLLVAPKKVNSFGIKQIQPLFAKHPGCGVPLAAGFRVLCLASPCSITPFRINTSKSITKQTTLTVSRINTYAKTGGGYPHPLPNVHDSSQIRNSSVRSVSTPAPTRSGRPILSRRSDVSTFRPSHPFPLQWVT